MNKRGIAIPGAGAIGVVIVTFIVALLFFVASLTFGALYWGVYHAKWMLYAFIACLVLLIIVVLAGIRFF